MCEKCNNKSFLNGALLGGIIGGLLGILYAPDSGKETRRKLASSSEKYAQKGGILLEEAESKYQEISDKVKPVLSKIEQKVLPILREIETASQPVREEFGEKVAQLVDEVGEKIKEEKKTVQKRYFK